MNRNKVAIRGGIWGHVFLMTIICSAPAQTGGREAPAQQMLDFLAKPFPRGGGMSMPITLPSHFADWTERQRSSGLQLVIQHCSLMNALEHDNPQARILPEPMTQREEVELAVSICIPANMPGDWPERRKYLDDARRLIAKADTQGGALRFPASLSQK